jgi:hypothetical protein
MKPQLKENTSLPQALYDYITLTSTERLSEDVFYLLASIFNSDSFKGLVTEEFITSIFDGLDIIKDEDNHYSIIKILMQINSDLTTRKENKLFLSIFNKHANKNPIIESMLRILNKEKEKNSMIIMLQFLIDIMEFKSECIFYRTDLESFIDLTVCKLQSTYTDELRYLILQVLEKVLQYDTYFDTKYKQEDLLEVLDDYSENQNVHEVNKELSKQLVNLLLK